MISLIVAHEKKRGIGFEQKIPWFIPGELRWVAQTTKHTQVKGKINALIMGRNTWYSLPVSRRPLIDRLNIVISATEIIPHDDVLTFTSLEAAIDHVNSCEEIETGFIFGGSSVYNEAFKKGYVDEALVNEVQLDCESDTFFPEIPNYLVKSTTEMETYGDVDVVRTRYIRK